MNFKYLFLLLIGLGIMVSWRASKQEQKEKPMSKKQAPIIVYLKPTCPFCHRAIALLQSKNTDIQIIDISKQPERRGEMISKAGGRTTVPQIFINSDHIGGFDDLNSLEQSGKLDKILWTN